MHMYSMLPCFWRSWEHTPPSLSSFAGSIQIVRVRSCILSGTRLTGLAVGGHHRRAVATAWQVGFGNSTSLGVSVRAFHSFLIAPVGGIIAVFAFLAKDAPKYIPGYSICIAFIGVSVAADFAYFYIVRSENKRRDAMQAKGDSGLSAEEKKLMGDLNPDYRYFL